MTVEDILSAHNIQKTGEEIRADLLAAGFVIVPREPTPAMIDAIYDQPSILALTEDDAKTAWSAMIDASTKEIA